MKEIVFRSALRLEIEAVLVASQRLPLPANNRFASAVRVDGGPDEADNYIAEHAEPGDIAVTADIPLASRLVGKGILTIDPRGTEYSRENIGERLSVRDFHGTGPPDRRRHGRTRGIRSEGQAILRERVGLNADASMSAWLIVFATQRPRTRCPRGGVGSFATWATT